MSYIGEVGKRITITATYKKRFEYTDYKFSYYGTTHLTHIFEDEEGNTIVWKSTNMVEYINDGSENPKRKGDVEFIPQGSVVELTGTVKEHSEYKGIEQTLVTRCKFKLVSLGKTAEERQQEKAEEQKATLTGRDFIWKMPYKQYKEHYSDCETLAGSYDAHLDSRGIPQSDPTIEVIIREGRLKPSGVRGQQFNFFTFKKDGLARTYRAVCEGNARKRLKKEFPDGDGWELYNITK